MFKVLNTKDKARRGELITRKGTIQTPCFMPIATKGAIKTITADEIRKLNPEVILSNTYHLMLRPGSDEIKKLGGLHSFMDWDRPILTDSGGFQVFSLAKMRKINAEGVTFNSHIDGRKYKMSPEDSMQIQLNIGSDIIMVLDECVKLPADRRYLEKSVELTTSWAKRCSDYLTHQIPDQVRNDGNAPLLFGIVQGGMEEDLRKKSADDLKKIGFDGYAVGGLAVGESEQEMCSVLDFTCPELPENAPRYLMGVGYPHQIVEAIKRGVDMFDCVIPTREARHGRLYYYTSKVKGQLSNVLNSDKEFYETINIKNEKFKFDLSPINEDSIFPELQKYSKAYLRHMFRTEDPLAQRLATLHNLEFYLGLMRKIREELDNA